MKEEPVQLMELIASTTSNSLKNTYVLNIYCTNPDLIQSPYAVNAKKILQFSKNIFSTITKITKL